VQHVVVSSYQGGSPIYSGNQSRVAGTRLCSVLLHTDQVEFNVGSAKQPCASPQRVVEGPKVPRSQTSVNIARYLDIPTIPHTRTYVRQ